ncbi:TolC family protein [Acidobacteriota bacterium]
MQKRMNSIKNSQSIMPIAVFLVLIWLILVPLESNAQDSGPRHFSLEEAQDFAIQHSYDSRRTLLDIEAAKKKLRETLAIGLPQISSAIGYTNNLELATVLIPNFFEGKFDEKIAVQFGTQHNANVGLTVSQLVFNGSYFVGLQTSKIYRQLADQNHERTQLNVLETVTNTYYLILVSEESIRILNSNLKNLEKTYFEISELYKEGFVAETDADLVKIGVTRLKDSLQGIVRQKDIAYNLLKFQMGLNLAEELVLSENLENILQRIDVQKAAENTFELSRNIDFQLLETQEKLTEMALKNEKAQYWPTVTAFYSFQWMAMRDSFNFFNFNENWFRTQLLGFNINLPIFKSGMQKAKVAQASIALKQAQTAKEQAAQGLKLQASQAKAEMDTAYDSYVNTKDNLTLSKKVYDRMLIKYKEGVSSSMDLTQANDQFLMAQSQYIQAMSQLLTAKNKIDRLHNNYKSK